MNLIFFSSSHGVHKVHKETEKPQKISSPLRDCIAMSVLSLPGLTEQSIALDFIDFLDSASSAE